jgi:hypothetical protein
VSTPKPDCYKMNIACSHCSVSWQVGLDMVICDHNDFVAATLCSCFAVGSKVFHDQARVVWWAYSLRWMMGFLE